MAEDQTNQSSKRLLFVAAAAILGLIGVSLFLQPDDMTVVDDGKSEDSQQQSDKSKQDDASDEQSKTNQDNFSYTAAAGDSYTVLARQAVAVLASGLSPAERVAAETKLTQDAGEPYLEIGQVVEFDQATVQAAVDWAKNLSQAEKAAWQPYADLVTLPEIK